MWELGLDTLDPPGVTPVDSIARSSTQPVASQLVSGSALDEHARDDFTVEDMAIRSADCSQWDHAGYWLRIEEMIHCSWALHLVLHFSRDVYQLCAGIELHHETNLLYSLVEQHGQHPFTDMMFMDLQDNHWTLFHHSLGSNPPEACTRYNPTSGVNSRSNIVDQWQIHNYLRPPGTSPIPLETSYVSFPTQLQEDSSTCGFWVVVIALTLLLHLDSRDVYALQPADIKTMLATLYAAYVCIPEGLTIDQVVEALAQHQLSSMELRSMHITISSNLEDFWPDTPPTMDAEHGVNPGNVMKLLKHVQQEPDAFMNLDARNYGVKIQKRGQLKWADTRFRTTRKLNGFPVGELKFAFDFPVLAKDHLKRLAEGKTLQGNGMGSSVEPLKDVILHSWITSLHLGNCPSKQLQIQAVTAPLWKAQYQQSKETYLYKERGKPETKQSEFGKMSQLIYHPYGNGIITNNWMVNDNIDAVDFNGKSINPLEIRNVFCPDSWVVAQITPTLWDIMTQDGGISRHTKTYQLVINRVQLALKPMPETEGDCLEGTSLSILKHARDDDGDGEETPPLLPAPKRTLLGPETFASSGTPSVTVASSSKLPSFKKKVRKKE
ncbi:hypothetical protein JB92DRAFT_3127908 [Gautieria morchelliformis]|nr:hypothetical protein JB92DRAFT_3127908 [Gautieria morchelliformis]